MIVFRLCKQKYAEDMSGRGAELTGGRWNSKGIPIIYTSQSRSLCTAEVAVHLPYGILPINYSLVAIEFPTRTKLLEVGAAELSSDWKSYPHSGSTQKVGDAFITENKYLVMKVPSVVVPGDYNYLINPRHKDIGKIKITSIEPFDFDERLFL